MQHVRKMQNLAQQVLTAGLEFVTEQDREGVDALATEIIALGTWCGESALGKGRTASSADALTPSGLLQTGVR